MQMIQAEVDVTYDQFYLYLTLWDLID
jgi:hypothetical protein